MRKAIAILFILLGVPRVFIAWGEKGHTLINRLAIENAGPQLPEFVRAGRSQIIYDAPEPDRWRDEVGTPMNTAQAPDHFFDSELWGPIPTIEADRYAFMEKASAKNLELVKIGYLPYAIVEMHGKLRNAFRQWRNAKAPLERDAARVDVLVYCGLLGHYVGDGSNPLHLSINYDGWNPKAPNAKGYRTAKGLHSQFESAYVNVAINVDDVRPRVKAPQRLHDVFNSIRDYLNETFNDLDTLYDLEKQGELDARSPKSHGTEFVSNELARGASMLSNLWYTAWLESAEPAQRQ